jgi:hypothetical protein
MNSSYRRADDGSEDEGPDGRTGPARRRPWAAADYSAFGSATVDAGAALGPASIVRVVRMKYARLRLSHRAVVTAVAEVDLVSDTLCSFFGQGFHESSGTRLREAGRRSSENVAVMYMAPLSVELSPSTSSAFRTGKAVHPA